MSDQVMHYDLAHMATWQNFPQCLVTMAFQTDVLNVDWLQSLKQFFINVSYHILVASLTLMALF